MNRAERRAAKYKKGPSRPRNGTKKAIDISPIFRVIMDRQILQPRDYVDDMLQTEARYERLCQGTADAADFDALALRLGTALNRASDIHDELEAEIQKACNAMDSLRNRYLERGNFILTGLEKQAIRLGMDYLDDMVRKSTRAQMQDAWDRCLRNIDKAMSERVKLGLPALPTKEHP